MPKSHPILLVEDNPDDQLLTIRALKSNNIINKVVVVSDGQEAVDYLHRRGEYAERSDRGPQFILLDINLPKLSGIEVLREIRNSPELRHLPVVILTSSKEDRDLIESYNLGVNSYIRKPVDFNQFTELVKQLGFYWLVINEVPEL